MAFLSPSKRNRTVPPAPLLEEALAWERRSVVGVDEVGRGPLAGPVVAAAVRLSPGEPLPAVHDSKRLTAPAREALFPEIVRSAAAVGVGAVTAGGIDRWNVREATRVAMIRAIEHAGVRPDTALVDGTRFASFPWPQVAVIGGDRSIPSIAAASIVAKVVRDRLMRSFHRLFPVYRFDRHKGYPTRRHAAAIAAFGSSPIHRKSFHVPVVPRRLSQGEGG